MTIAISGTNGITLDGQFNSASSMGFKNRIINGAMVIDQRNAGASVTGNNTVYTLDRWVASASQTSKFTVQQNAGSITPPANFIKYLGITSSSAYSIVSTDLFGIQQRIEGFNMADFNWGTANAATVTLSFWVRSSLTGTFGGAMLNSAANRSYPFSYTILSANTWEQKTVTIAGDTTGTWLSDNGIGAYLNFGIGAGSTYSGTAGSWAGAFYLSATGATSVVGTSGATFYITGVQLEKGSTATSFDYRPYGTELALCQRYFQILDHLSMLGARSTTSLETSIMFPLWMRGTPTIDTSTSQVYQVYDAFGTGFTQSSVSVNFAVSGATTKGAFLAFNNFTGLTQGRTYITNAAGFGKLGLTAEL